jgi:hypothetical protein
MICVFLSGLFPILEIIANEEWNSEEVQVGRYHRQVAYVFSMALFLTSVSKTTSMFDHQEGGCSASATMAQICRRSSLSRQAGFAKLRIKGMTMQGTDWQV